MNRFKVGLRIDNGYLDHLEVEPAGLLRVVGWKKGALAEHELPKIELDGRAIPLLQSFRFGRPDVQKALRQEFSLFGLGVEYLVPITSCHRGHMIRLELPSGRRASFSGDFNFTGADYHFLLNSSEVFHRDQIYGSGLPNNVVHPEVAELAKQLPPPVLDFGCGRGSLVHFLRENGTEAYGLELNSPVIQTHMLPEVAPAITLYDGRFPSPFSDGQFRSIMCSEVLEHITGYVSAIEEIVRIARDRVIFTVPDASAIPLGFRNGVVPWHLLEGSHVNFFTQQSLAAALKPYFHKIDFARIGGVSINGSEFYVSLVGICSGPIPGH